jgi:predicted enzyme related to lactoylglutathione lyase|tara:strand:- start:6833 stop:7633 length:801 start_codon:yes stop_codon:yes gene_type:complete
MKKLIRFASVTVVLCASVATRAAESTYHHVHIRASDPKAAAEWYSQYMGGKKLDDSAVQMSSAYLLVFPEDFFGADGSPHQGGELKGSEGTAADHLGFSFEKLDAKMEEFKSAGIEILQEVREVPGKFKYAMIMDPWGTKLEVMEDPELFGLHHVHVVSKDPQKAIIWYQEIFGGEITTYKGLSALPAIRYGGMWLIISKTNREIAPTEFRSIDHLGWGMPNLAKEMARIKGRGEKIVAKLHDYLGTNYAYIESPEGALIELAETQ